MPYSFIVFTAENATFDHRYYVSIEYDTIDECIDATMPVARMLKESLSIRTIHGMLIHDGACFVTDGIFGHDINNANFGKCIKGMRELRHVDAFRTLTSARK